MELQNISVKDFTVEKIPSNVGRSILIRNHYTKGCHRGPICYGLKYNDLKFGVLAFAVPVSENVRRSIWKDKFEDMKDKTIELHRLYTVDNTPKNTESYFISKSLKLFKQQYPKYKAVISFSDMTENHLGIVYQATNALYYGMTKTKTVFYRDEKGRLRSPRQCGVNISKNEAKRRGWKIEKRDYKHKYLYLLDKTVKDKLGIEIKDYPKEGDNFNQDYITKTDFIREISKYFNLEPKNPPTKKWLQEIAIQIVENDIHKNIDP